MTAPIRIFLSYDFVDSGVAEDLRKHLLAASNAVAGYIFWRRKGSVWAWEVEKGEEKTSSISESQHQFVHFCTNLIALPNEWPNVSVVLK